MKVTFAQIGNYSIAVKDLIEKLGCQFVPADQTNVQTVQQGVKMAPETICFPCKVNLGNYLSAIEKGADTILMFDSQGQCRFRYYGMLQRKILKEYGHKVSFVIFSAKSFLSQLDKLNKISAFKKYLLIRFVWKKAKLIELIEQSAWHFRPREATEGQTDKLVKVLFAKLADIDKIKKLKEFKTEIEQSFRKITIDSQRQILKIGLIGEIFTVIDSYTNQQLENMLGKMGVEVHRDLTLTAFVKHSLNPWHDKGIRKKARGYLNYIVGGHGLESVVEMLHYAKSGYDGVIHLWPFGCMPEVTVRPILEKIKNEHNIALLGLSLDEQTGQAGIKTRLEAFVDLMKSKKQAKKSL